MAQQSINGLSPAPASQGDTLPRAQPWRKRVRQYGVWYLFLTPALVSFLLFNLFTWLFLVGLSFSSWNLVGDRSFVGLNNYAYLLTNATFREAFVNTFQYVLIYVIPMAILSLGLALLVNQQLRGVQVFRAAYFLPVVTNIAVIAMIWKYLFQPTPDGPLNYFLGLAGIPYQEWLLNTHLALPSLGALGIWASVGYYMVLWLAGLQAIPSELYEAAAIDGADGWQLLRFITVPLLRPTTVFVVIIATIRAFQIFGQVYLLTGGGPINSTSTLVFFMWNQAFSFYRMGRASAVAVVLFLVILAIALIQRRYLRWSESLF